MASVENLLNLTLSELETMSRRDLAHNISVLASAANKRMARMEQKGVISQAANYVKSHGGKFSVKGKDTNELITEYKRVTGFLTSNTGTIKGAIRARENNLQAIAEATNENYSTVRDVFDSMSRAQERSFWKAVDRLRDTKSEYGARGSSELIGAVAQAYVDTGKKRVGVDRLFENAEKVLREEYEIRMENDEDDFGW